MMNENQGQGVQQYPRQPQQYPRPAQQGYPLKPAPAQTQVPQAQPVPRQQAVQSTSQGGSEGPSPDKGLFDILDARMLIPILAIILLLVVGFLVYYFMISGGSEQEAYTPETVMVEEPGVVMPERVPEAVPEDTSVPTDVVETDEEFSGCLSVLESDDYDASDECFFQLAKQRRSVRDCNMITKSSGPGSVDACYEYLAKANMEPQFCYSITAFDGPNSFHSCITSLAYITDNPAMCLLLSSEEGDYSESACIAKFNMTEEDFYATYAPDE